MIYELGHNKLMVRNKIKELKNALSKEEIKDYSNKIYHNVLTSLSFDQYEEVYIYVSFNQEVDTSTIIDYLIQQGVKIGAPKIMDGHMEFYYINDKNQLEPGFYGILEPTTDRVADGNNILMIMPGLAFDLHGNRIGYGAGYYDKYLHEYHKKRIHKIALAYDFQIVEQIENNEYDVGVDGIITPTREYIM